MKIKPLSDRVLVLRIEEDEVHRDLLISNYLPIDANCTDMSKSQPNTTRLAEEDAPAQSDGSARDTFFMVLL